MHRHIQDINDYILDVLDGTVPVCEYVKLAAQRHLDDLKRSEDRDYPFEFSHDACIAFLNFCELHYHVKGPWAGTKIRLEPWQKFVFGVPFGWLYKKTGLRRFREIYAEICRKNSKSTAAALVGLYMGAEDCTGAPEIYSGATTEKQAKEVFEPAWKMAYKNEDFQRYYKINLTGTSKNPTGIYFLKNGGKFVPIIGNPGDGPSPSCSITDEYHEHPTNAQYNSMVTGMGSREQPLRLIITTAGEDTSRPCYEKRSDCIKMLQNVLPNDELWAVIYTIDEKDNWEDFGVWKKANPNMGVSVFTDFLEARHKEALTKKERQSIIKCKHLNIWSSLGGGKAFVNMPDWNKLADKSLNIDDFEDQECAMGVDLASKIDMAACVKVFRRDGKYYVFPKCYLPEKTVERSENEHYRRWAGQGHLIVTPGARIDFEYIEDDIRADIVRYQLRGLGYDPQESNYLINNLTRENDNITCVEIGQNASILNGPMKEFEALVESGGIVHDGNPVLSWMVSNVIKKQSRNKKYYPGREREKSKIDAFMCILFSLIVWEAEVEDCESVYDERGILIV